MSIQWNRRRFNKALAGSTAALAAYRFSGYSAFAQDEEPDPINLGEGGTNITMWVQDFGPRINSFRTAAERYIQQGNDDVSVTVQPIPYDQMLPKQLPAIATGNEADIMMGYTTFYVATDVSQLFLRLDDVLGGVDQLEEIFYAATLNALDTPDNSLYYLPQGTGLNGCAITVDKSAWDEAGIDYTSLKTWEEFLDAAREMTSFDDSGNMIRAGLSNFGTIETMTSWVWQLGGSFYDDESGEWSFSTPEGERALEMHAELYTGESPVCSLDLISTPDTQIEDMAQGRLASHMAGAYAVGNTEDLFPDFEADGFPTPPIADAVENVINPGHSSVITLSRRLADDEAKRDHCIGIVREIYNVEAQLEYLNTYSGSVMNKEVYADDRLGESRYGEFSAMISDATFPRSRNLKAHVANTGPAVTEFSRAVRGEISIQDALKNADDYLNEQERQARERIG